MTDTDERIAAAQAVPALSAACDRARDRAERAHVYYRGAADAFRAVRAVALREREEGLPGWTWEVLEAAETRAYEAYQAAQADEAAAVRTLVDHTRQMNAGLRASFTPAEVTR